MKNWFLELTRREQLYLLVLAAVLVLWVVFQLLLAPAAAQRDQMMDNNRNAAALLARVDVKVSQLIALRSEAGSKAVGSLSATITRSTELAELSVRRLQPNSRGEVQVRFESVDYDALVTWLHRIETVEGLVIIDASIAQAGRSGGVNATVRLAEAS